MINDFFLTEWFFDLLRWLYSVLGNNYFLTIFIVTLALRIIQTVSYTHLTLPTILRV